ncbi:MAG: glycosyltransferase, partial [Candidatus Omnitrophica bacterium]|nr:glycosyltransferase [Candidatus Omnitrophota bacterium]
MNESQCDIIIVVWNQLTATRKCVDAIERSTHYPYRLILVDNNSDEYTAEYLNGLARGRDSVTLIRNSENMGFIKAANQGLRLAASPYVCLMNNDTVATAGWLGKMVALAESDTGIGLVNPKSESPGSLSLEE